MKNNVAPTILVREGSAKGYCWKQYMVVTDERVAVVEMTPAMFGWNIGRVTVQSGDDWRGLNAAAIVAWKAQSDDRAKPANDITPDFLSKLLVMALPNA
jgi:hypothetical protein